MAGFAFLHTADSSLGAEWPPTSRAAHALAREAYWRAFEQVIEFALAQRVDFVVHAGDLVDVPDPDIGFLGRLLWQLRRLEAAGIPFVITSAPQERSALAALEEDGGLIQVEGLAGPRPFHDLSAGGAQVRIHGVGEHARREREALAAASEAFDRRGADFAILAMHAHVGSPPAPLSLDDVRDLCLDPGIDYIALGHLHRRFEAPDHRLCNAGSTEWSNFDEAAEAAYRWRDGQLARLGVSEAAKGFYLVTVSDGAASPRFVPVETRYVRRVRVEFEGAPMDEVARGLTAALAAEASAARDAILKPVIAGTLGGEVAAEEIAALAEPLAQSVDALYVEFPAVAACGAR